MQSEWDQRGKSHSALQRLGEFLYVASIAGEERGGGVRGELACISSNLQGPQLGSTTFTVRDFKLGNSFGILLVMLSSHSSLLTGVFGGEITFMCVQASIRGGGVTAILENSF